jgi:STE24 endopeptidase
MIWNAYSLLVVGLMAFMFVANVTLALLNFSYRNKPLPSNVKDIYSKSKYLKSKAYFSENTLFSLVKNTFNFILFLALLVAGFFPWVAQLAQGLTDNTLLQTFFFFLILIVLNTLLSIPFNYYKTFSIETRYGFNKTTKKLFFTDLVRNVFISSLLIALITVLLQALYQSLGDAFILGAWLALSIILILLFMLNTKVFIKIFNKLTPLPDSSLKTAIVELANKTGFKAKAIYSMDASKRSSKLNAFFSGFGPIREIALFDTLIAKLSQEEILAVLAHEIGHAKHFDEIRMLIQQVLVFGVYAFIINLVVGDAALALAFGFNAPFFAFGLILFSVLIEPLTFLLGIPLNYLSRKAEYAADNFAVKQGYQTAMASALKTLTTENFGNLTPHPLQVWFTYSHPPMTDRLAAIENKPR